MKWYEQMIERAKTFLREGKDLIPMLFLMSDGKLGVLPLSMVVHDKDLMSGFMRLVISSHNPDEYLFLTESYVKMLDPKDQGEQVLGRLLVDGALAVRQLPSSQEAIVALHGDRKGERICFITFSGKGRTLKFGKAKWLTEEGAQGRFMNLRGKER